jgi:hypothetical protein
VRRKRPVRLDLAPRVDPELGVFVHRLKFNRPRGQGLPVCEKDLAVRRVGLPRIRAAAGQANAGHRGQRQSRRAPSPAVAPKHRRLLMPCLRPNDNWAVGLFKSHVMLGRRMLPHRIFGAGPVLHLLEGALTGQVVGTMIRKDESS